MYRLTIITGFAAAHNLLNYQGSCENLHGHNWKVEVAVAARDLDQAGMGIDFKILKTTTRQILVQFDHKYLNDLDCFRAISPSSENIARLLFEELKNQLNTDDVKVEKVKVWESENACASYSLD
ncbi:MAG: 6-carboxytetrahydropterin synthase QueD [Geopsychrobacter sp.]|nr:6-carboxytetrahydropterin synthase QueD [Geopsychrobacter sp.]